MFNFQGILALNIIDHASMVFFTAGEPLAWKIGIIMLDIEKKHLKCSGCVSVDCWMNHTDFSKDY